MALVLLDLDGTLLRGPSSEQRFITHLALHGVLGPRQYAAAIGFVLRHGRRFGRHVWRKNKAYLAELPVDRIEALGARYAEARLAMLLRPSMARRLDRHRAAGDTLALLTGAPDFLARPLAQRLEIPHWVATRCARRGGRFTASPPLVHPFRESKVELAERLRQELGFEWASCAAYGDSAHDIPLLEKVGRPVAVAPSRTLRAHARSRGWEILGA